MLFSDKHQEKEHCLYIFSTFCSKLKMTFRNQVALPWKKNENGFCQVFLNPWHMLSSIWVHFGLWRSIFIVKIWFSHIFPASAWSPYQSLFLRHEIEKGLRAVYPYMRHALDMWTDISCGKFCAKLFLKVWGNNIALWLLCLNLDLRSLNPYIEVPGTPI